MKKFTTFAIGILFFALVSTSSFGQSVTIIPTSSAGLINIKRDGKGLSHTSANGLVQVGTFANTFSGAYIQTHSNHPLNFSTNNNLAQMTLLQNGSFGIGTETPDEKLTVKTATNNYGLLHTDGTVSLGTYVSNLPRASFGTKSNHDLTFFTNNGGSQMILKTSGMVGIGTTNPLAPLHVAGQSTINGSVSGRYFNYASAVNTITAYTGVEYPSILADASIITNTTFLAFQTIAASDFRIKNIIGLSDNAKDLAKLKKIEITDYTMKDVGTWGTQSFKKVIAQQVEKVYPEIVTKQHKVIPDIYALAEKVNYDAVKKELKCSLSKSYDIKIGDKIELVHPEKGKIQAVVASVSGNEFTVKDWLYATDKIFVFGREVSDFRTVDYDALSMLGISAIQQLAKENEELKHRLDKLETLEKRLNALEANRQ